MKVFGSQPLCFDCWSGLDLEFAEFEDGPGMKDTVPDLDPELESFWDVQDAESQKDVMEVEEE